MSNCCGPTNGRDTNRAPVPAVSFALPGVNEIRYRVSHINGPVEEKGLRDKLSRIPGVHALEFNRKQQLLIIDHLPEAAESVLAGIHELGFTAERLTESEFTASKDRAAVVRGKLVRREAW